MNRQVFIGIKISTLHTFWFYHPSIDYALHIIIHFIFQNTRMQATVRMALVNQFKDRLKEGNAVTLQRYSLGEIQPKFRIVTKPLRLSFLSNTECVQCLEFTGSKHGFVFRQFNTIVELKKEEDGQFGIYILFELIHFCLN